MAYEQVADPEAVEGEATPERHPAEVLLSFIAPNVVNLVPMLDADVVNKIGAEVVRGYDIDKASRSDWEKQTKIAMDLALQVATEKSFPWPKAANVKYPLITTAAIQFSARAYPAIVKGADVVKGQVIGPDPQGTKKQRADRIGRHMSYQVLEEIEDWDEEVDKLLLRMSIVGCEFRKTYFDRARGRNCSDLIPAEFVVYNHKVQFRKLRRLTHLLYLFKNEVIERQRGGIWSDITLGLPEGEDNDEDGHFEFLEQYCWYDLDKDGYKEPYIVTVKKESGEVVRILPNFDGALVAAGSGLKRGIHLNAKGEIAKIDQVDYWTKFEFMANPDGGSYGIGLGILLNPINETVNTVLNQMLDAGTLANTGGGFLGSGLKMKGGVVRFVPGEFKPIDNTGGDIAKNVYQMQFPGPSAVLFELLGMLIEAAKDISSVKDILTGEQEVNQTATTTLALIEQGQKVFSAIYKRVHRSLKQEFKKLYRLNKLYLKPEDYYRFQDKVEPIYLEDYQGDDTDVAPVSDPTLVSDAQQLTRAQAVMELRGDPMVNQKWIRQSYLTALKVENIEEALDTSQNPPPPMDPAQAKQAMQEMQQKGDALKQQEQAIGQQIQAAQADMAAKEQALADQVQQAEQSLQAKEQAIADQISQAEQQLAAERQQLDLAGQEIQAELEKLAAAQRELALREQMASQGLEFEAAQNEAAAQVLEANLNEQAAEHMEDIAKAEAAVAAKKQATKGPAE